MFSKYYTLLFHCLMLLQCLFIAVCKGNEATSLSISQSPDHQCSPWFFYNTVIGKCQCFRSRHTDYNVICTEQGALLRYGNCMTYEEGIGTFVGRCQSL